MPVRAIGPSGVPEGGQAPDQIVLHPLGPPGIQSRQNPQRPPIVSVCLPEPLGVASPHEEDSLKAEQAAENVGYLIWQGDVVQEHPIPLPPMPPQETHQGEEPKREFGKVKLPSISTIGKPQHAHA